MVVDMERALEILTRLSEENWTDKLEINENGHLCLGKKFTKFREDVAPKQKALLRYFNRTMESIRERIPEIVENENDD